MRSSPIVTKGLTASKALLTIIKKKFLIDSIPTSNLTYCFQQKSMFRVAFIVFKRHSQKGLIEEPITNSTVDITKIFDKLRVTYNANTGVLSRVNGQSIQIWPSDRNELITITFNELFYDRLASEINFCYKCACYTSVCVLARKMAENLVIEIIRTGFKHVKDKGLPSYWNISEGRFHDFSYLIAVLGRENKSNSFGPDKRDIIKQIITLIKPFRKNANANVHSIIENPTEREFIQLNIPEIMALLVKCWRNL